MIKLVTGKALKCISKSGHPGFKCILRKVLISNDFFIVYIYAYRLLNHVYADKLICSTYIIYILYMYYFY